MPCCTHPKRSTPSVLMRVGGIEDLMWQGYDSLREWASQMGNGAPSPVSKSACIWHISSCLSAQTCLPPAGCIHPLTPWAPSCWTLALPPPSAPLQQLNNIIPNQAPRCKHVLIRRKLKTTALTVRLPMWPRAVGWSRAQCHGNVGTASESLSVMSVASALGPVERLGAIAQT